MGVCVFAWVLLVTDYWQCMRTATGRRLGAEFLLNRWTQVIPIGQQISHSPRLTVPKGSNMDRSMESLNTGGSPATYSCVLDDGGSATGVWTHAIRPLKDAGLGRGTAHTHVLCNTRANDGDSFLGSPEHLRNLAL